MHSQETGEATRGVATIVIAGNSANALMNKIDNIKGARELHLAFDVDLLRLCLGPTEDPDDIQSMFRGSDAQL